MRAIDRQGQDQQACCRSERLSPTERHGAATRAGSTGSEPGRSFRTGYRRRSIGLRLIVALAAMTLLSVGAGLLAIISFDRIEQHFTHLAVRNLDRTITAAEIGRSSGEISRLAPALLSSRNISELDDALAGINLRHERLTGLINQLRGRLNGSGSLDAVARHSDQLRATADAIALLVGRRIAAEQRLDTVSSSIQDLTEQVDGIVDRFLISPGPAPADASAYGAPDRSPLSDLDIPGSEEGRQAAVDWQHAFQRVAVSAERLAEASDSDAFRARREEYGAEIVALAQRRLPGAITAPLLAAQSQLMQTAVGPEGVFDLKREVMSVTAEGRMLLGRLHRAADELAVSVRGLTVAVRDEVTASNRSLVDALSANRNVLMMLIALCVAAALAIGSYMHLLVSRRLNRLREIMIERTRGLDRPIDISGNDEISDMAAAVVTFVEIIEAREGALRDGERRLAMRNSLLSAAQEASPDGMIAFDPQRHVISFNNRFAEIWNLRPEDLVDTSREQLMGCVNANLLNRDAATLRADKAYADPNLKVNDYLDLKDGRCLHRHSTALIGDDGTCYGRIWFYRDMTDRIRHEQQIEAANAILEEQKTELVYATQSLEVAREEAEAARLKAELANRAKSEFLAMMSHELRTPLNAIIGFSEIMRDRPVGPDDLRRYAEYARDINESGVHLLSLINDILDLSKVEAGQMEIRPEPIAVTDLVKSSLKLIEGMTRSNGIRLYTDIPDHVTTLTADRRAAKQVVVNLLSNAVKFTDNGGAVRLSARRRDDGATVLIITDTGIGMPTDAIDRALEPFSQVGSVITRRHHGTGLGLPLAKGLIELHGGYLTLVSKPQFGTMARLVFPACPSA